MEDEFVPTVDLRFIYRETTDWHGHRVNKSVLQQKWVKSTLVGKSGLQFKREYEWRDVPLVSDAEL